MSEREDIINEFLQELWHDVRFSEKLLSEDKEIVDKQQELIKSVGIVIKCVTELKRREECLNLM